MSGPASGATMTCTVARVAATRKAESKRRPLARLVCKGPQETQGN